MSDRLGRIWYHIVYWTGIFFLTFGWSLRVRGRTNMPKRGPLLIISNHQSFLDPLMLGIACPRYIKQMARETLFHNRFLGGLISSLGGFPIDNKGLGKAGLQTTLDLLQQGKVVVVFAEGTRTEDGRIRPLQAGISLLIRKVHCPIIPIGIAGAYDTWPKQQKFPSLASLLMVPWAGTIGISIGKPLDPKPFLEMDRETMLRSLREAMVTEWQNANASRRK